MSKITNVSALEILDSRGNWTVEAQIEMGGFLGKGRVPGGGSIGTYEKKVVPAQTAVSAINGLLKERLNGSEFSDQRQFDNFLINFDADPERSSLGANTMLALSIAFAKALSLSKNQPLYSYFADLLDNKNSFFMPIPLFNVINGGRHAEDDLDFQEFHFIPKTKTTFGETLELGVSLFHSLGRLLDDNGFGKSLGDEGGYSPRSISHQRALSFIIEAGEKVNLKTGQDLFLGLDIAASTLFLGDVYEMKREGFSKTEPELLNFYLELVSDYPIVYLEDPFNQDSFSDFALLKKKVGEKVEIAGDDLVATALSRLKTSIAEKAISAVIIKPNQIGTLSEAVEVAQEALKAGISLVVSHRSGETEDTYIADLAVGLGAKYFKAGAPARGERVAKYNRLLEIEQELRR